MLYAVVALLALVGVVAIKAFNPLVTLRNRVRNAFAQIDVQLKRRHDLIPNLVETVKGYMAHERGTLEAVVQARGASVAAQGAVGGDPSRGTLMRDLVGAESQLTAALGQLRVVSERYPDASVTAVAAPAGVILSTLALAGGADQAEAAYAAGVARLGLARPPARRATYDARAYAQALSIVGLATSAVRRRVVEAAAAVVDFDGQARPEELELLRAAAAAFGAPLPPLGRAGAMTDNVAGRNGVPSDRPSG